MAILLKCDHVLKKTVGSVAFRNRTVMSFQDCCQQIFLSVMWGLIETSCRQVVRCSAEQSPPVWVCLHFNRNHEKKKILLVSGLALFASGVTIAPGPSSRQSGKRLVWRIQERV